MNGAYFIRRPSSRLTQLSQTSLTEPANWKPIQLAAIAQCVRHWNPECSIAILCYWTPELAAFRFVASFEGLCLLKWMSVYPKRHISLHHQTLIFINFIFVNTGIRVHNGRPICWWIRILNFEETQRESHEIMAVIRTLCEFLKRPLVYILVVCLLLWCGYAVTKMTFASYNVLHFYYPLWSLMNCLHF